MVAQRLGLPHLSLPFDMKGEEGLAPDALDRSGRQPLIGVCGDEIEVGLNYLEFDGR
jgi:hypothetical protein